MDVQSTRLWSTAQLTKLLNQLLSEIVVETVLLAEKDHATLRDYMV